MFDDLKKIRRIENGFNITDELAGLMAIKGRTTSKYLCNELKEVA
jgi:hypothetical protein